MEGVLTPEIWIAVAEKTGIPELRRTTRDEPDYDKLMRGRLAILDKHGLKLSDIQNVIGSLSPLPGGKEFLDELRSLVREHADRCRQLRRLPQSVLAGSVLFGRDVLVLSRRRDAV